MHTHRFIFIQPLDMGSYKGPICIRYVDVSICNKNKSRTVQKSETALHLFHLKSNYVIHFLGDISEEIRYKMIHLHLEGKSKVKCVGKGFSKTWIKSYRDS